MIRIALALAAALAFAPAVLAVSPQPASAQTAPAASVTDGFAAFLTAVLAGRMPANVSSTMRAQATELLSGVKSTLAPYGALRSLRFLHQESMQGYRRYHYSAIFAKGTLPVAFVTDSKGVIVGFFEDQPGSSTP